MLLMTVEQSSQSLCVLWALGRGSESRGLPSSSSRLSPALLDLAYAYTGRTQGASTFQLRRTGHVDKEGDQGSKQAGRLSSPERRRPTARSDVGMGSLLMI